MRLERRLLLVFLVLVGFTGLLPSEQEKTGQGPAKETEKPKEDENSTKTPGADEQKEKPARAEKPASREGEGERTFDLDEIVVTATRGPERLGDITGTVSLVGPEGVRLKGRHDAGSLVADLPGAEVKRYGGPGSSTSVHLRGLYGKHVVVMIDGRRVNSPSLGGADLSSLSPNKIERVEVVRGGYSSLYGADAVGGVVNFITKDPPEEPYVRVSTAAGRWRTIISRVEQGASFGDFGYIFNANYEDTDGHRDNSDYWATD
ncbi:MAG: TonB-dependent receptor plug domain-containing protein, partial [Planctomycetota bacterium]|nr:TonB-dependent receptor plug domain-containing protein [Planctomycetota bacterium]